MINLKKKSRSERVNKVMCVKLSLILCCVLVQSCNSQKSATSEQEQILETAKINFGVCRENVLEANLKEIR